MYSHALVAGVSSSALLPVSPQPEPSFSALAYRLHLAGLVAPTGQGDCLAVLIKPYFMPSFGHDE